MSKSEGKTKHGEEGLYARLYAPFLIRFSDVLLGSGSVECCGFNKNHYVRKCFSCDPSAFPSSSLIHISILQ